MSAQPELPTGTVTFLFTDVEGSTKLLHEFGPKPYAEALERHRRALREAFAAYEGVEVDTQGDAFFVAFAGAEDAVAAATAAQTALADGPIAVRMGIHTGAPLVSSGGYVGVDVHKAARICAAGHGGQVLLSEATRRLVDVPLRPLGAHRLKDLAKPEPLYQLGEADFPPIRTLNQSTLPIQATQFLGRERELGEIIGRLRRPEVRLLTLTGPGGSGKTRLALQAAAEVVEHYPHGVWWVPLQAVHDPALVLPAISSALDTTEQPAAHIADRHLLLVLDNLEQVAESGRELAGLLEACPRLVLLATSRELLHIGAEQAYPVQPFVPEEGVGFFHARARAVDPAFSADGAVAAICERLDNLPLALELAAARVRVLTPEQILERLERRLPLLTGGARDAPERQRTLRAAIAWSHDLLGADDRLLFARLAAFAGGCTLGTAERVCDADLDVLQSLVDKSLLRLDDGRFTMLETIREFAAEQLELSGEADEVRRRHAEHFLALGESANLSAESEGPERSELVRPEQDNLRRAIEWASDHDLELAFRLAISLEQFWVMNDPFEGVRRFAALLERSGDISPVLRARALRVYAESSWIAGELEDASRLMEESLAAFRRLGDEQGVAVLLHRVGVSALVGPDLPRARRLFEESVAMSRRLGLEKLEADAVGKLGWVERAEGNRERALELFEDSAVRCERVGFTWMQAGALFDAADLAHELGRPATAEARAREGLRLFHQTGDRQTAVAGLALLARFAATDGRVESAGRLWGAVEAEEARGRLGLWEHNREEYAAVVLAHVGPEFEAGRSAGRRLSLEQAVTDALS